MRPVLFPELLHALRAHHPVMLHAPTLFDSAGDSADIRLTAVMQPDRAAPGAVSWRRPGRPLEYFDGTVLIQKLGDEVPGCRTRPHRVIGLEDPRRAMADVLRECFADLQGEHTVHPTANIHPSVVIGPWGQGRFVDGTPFPQVGGIYIERDVTIGPYCTIMCAAIGDTVIQRGTSIGNGVNIGHGAVIGQNVLISAHASIGGSAVIDDGARVWMGANVAHGVRVGRGAVVGMGAAVLTDVPPGATVAGVPARIIREGA